MQKCFIKVKIKQEGKEKKKRKEREISAWSIQLTASLLEYTKSIELSSKTLLFKYTKVLMPGFPRFWLNSIFR